MKNTPTHHIKGCFRELCSQHTEHLCKIPHQNLNRSPWPKWRKPLHSSTTRTAPVVSREIVKKPTGTVTVFAFDKGEGLSEHTAPFDALVQVLEGEIEIIISGQPYRLQDGEMILMPPDNRMRSRR